MFGRRKDGKEIKVDPIMKLSPYFMMRRSDAQNYAKLRVRCDGFDDFIRHMRESEGEFYTYFDIVMAAAIRAFAMRKGINRFVNRGRLFQRDRINVCYIAKRGLRDEAVETNVKNEFLGHENIAEIRNTVQDTTSRNLSSADNSTDKSAEFLAKFPSFIIRWVIGFLKLLERYNMMPKSFIDTSPFHTSLYITNLKSIKNDYIYHHCYDFGTTGVFISMGKEQTEPVVEGDKIVPAKIMTLGITTDERVCDGLYLVKTLKLFGKLMENPMLLLEEYHDETIDKEIAKDKLKKEKRNKKKGPQV